MIFSIITLFPEMFDGPFKASILKRAQNSGAIEIRFINLRDFGEGRHKVVDDRPYGGGVGMVLKVDVMDRAIQATRIKDKTELVILLDPKGQRFMQSHVEEFKKVEHLVLICGHYEGYDARIRSLIDRQISLGDFVLTGGEIPAMAVVDAVARHIPGVLQKADTPQNESFTEVDGQRILEHEHYTRPEKYKGMKVPEILLSGNHAKIHEYQLKEAREITKKSIGDRV